MSLRKKLASAVIAGAMASTLSSGAQAATIVTDVDITFPQILVLYAFDSIQFDVTAAGLAAEIASSGVVASDGDFVTANLIATNVELGFLNGNGTANANIQDAATPLASVAVTVENAFGVRSLGIQDAAYTATAGKSGDDNDVFSNIGVTQPGNTGLALSPGDLTFTLNLNLVESTIESQEIEISVTGT